MKAMHETVVPSHDYVHGYSRREHERLFDQANTLTDLLHHDTVYSPGSRVLEAGCGVGAQTITLARNSPDAQITSIDVSSESLDKARHLVRQQQIDNVELQQANIFDLPFEDHTFDHVFVCFVLEHLPNPEQALTCLKRVLTPGGTITAIEGDHESAYFYPRSEDAKAAIQCLVDMQAKCGGNALIGRQLFPLLSQAGYRRVRVSPRMVYVDSSRPEWVEGFTKNTFIAMVEGVREQVLDADLMPVDKWDKGIRDLYRTTQPDGTFCYTFFKGVGLK
jgi:ubiquinone/menaquinone biosynthesis C-methylase UbiE